MQKWQISTPLHGVHCTALPLLIILLLITSHLLTKLLHHLKLIVMFLPPFSKLFLSLCNNRKGSNLLMVMFYMLTTDQQTNTGGSGPHISSAMHTAHFLTYCTKLHCSYHRSKGIKATLVLVANKMWSLYRTIDSEGGIEAEVCYCQQQPACILWSIESNISI